jgi:hypothetical protein
MDNKYMADIMIILSQHTGREKAIGMAQLYEAVYQRPWRNKINDTRELRRLITALRYQGALIGESRGRTGGGYYLARSTHELTQFFDRRKHEALKKLLMVSKMQKIGLHELMGQMAFNIKTQSAASGPEGPTPRREGMEHGA